MTYKIAILPLATKDISRAAKWYDDRAAGYGRKLVEQFDAALASVSQNPALYREIGNGVRRAIIQDFPYSAFFMVEGDTVFVFACLHQRRNPSIWKHRSKTVGYRA